MYGKKKNTQISKLIRKHMNSSFIFMLSCKSLSLMCVLSGMKWRLLQTWSSMTWKYWGPVISYFFQLQSEYLKHFRNVSPGPCRLAPALITLNVLHRRASRSRVVRLQRYQDVVHVDLCRFWFVVLSWYPLACLRRFYNENEIVCSPTKSQRLITSNQRCESEVLKIYIYITRQQRVRPSFDLQPIWQTFSFNLFPPVRF